MPLRAAVIILASIALMAVACGGGKSSSTPTVAPAKTGASTPAASATGGASAGTTTPGAGETSTAATPGAAGATDAAALAAAQSVFNGVDCSQATPGSSATSCLQSLSDAATIAAGLSAWKVSAQGGSSYTGVLGKTADGSWKLWFSSQDVIWQLALPGRMRVCADGQGLNLRKTAATTADRIASIADNTIVDGDKFVLTEPGTPTQRGYGWYHLTTNPDGWAYSKFLVDAAQPNCDARNRLEAAH